MKHHTNAPQMHITLYIIGLEFVKFHNVSLFEFSAPLFSFQNSIEQLSIIFKMQQNLVEVTLRKDIVITIRFIECLIF